MHLNGCKGHQTVFFCFLCSQINEQPSWRRAPNTFPLHLHKSNYSAACGLQLEKLFILCIINYFHYFKEQPQCLCSKKSQRYFISSKRNQVISNRGTPNQYQPQTTLWVHHILVCSLISTSCQTSHLTYIQFPENLTTMSDLHNANAPFPDFLQLHGWYLKLLRVRLGDDLNYWNAKNNCFKFVFFLDCNIKTMWDLNGVFEYIFIHEYKYRYKYQQ